MSKDNSLEVLCELPEIQVRMIELTDLRILKDMQILK